MDTTYKQMQRELNRILSGVNNLDTKTASLVSDVEKPQDKKIKKSGIITILLDEVEETPRSEPVTPKHDVFEVELELSMRRQMPNHQTDLSEASNNLFDQENNFWSSNKRVCQNHDWDGKPSNTLLFWDF